MAGGLPGLWRTATQQNADALMRSYHENPNADIDFEALRESISQWADGACHVLHRKQFAALVVKCSKLGLLRMQLDLRPDDKIINDVSLMWQPSANYGSNRRSIWLTKMRARL